MSFERNKKDFERVLSELSDYVNDDNIAETIDASVLESIRSVIHEYESFFLSDIEDLYSKIEELQTYINNLEAEINDLEGELENCNDN